MHKKQVNNPSGAIDVGVARIDITPQTPIRLSGYAARVKDEANSVLRNLYAKAIVFGSDKEAPSLFITVDLIGVQAQTTKLLVEQLAKTTKLKPSQIVISSSHTHGGPEVGNLINILQSRGKGNDFNKFNDSLLTLPELLHIAKFSEQLGEKLKQVAMAALANRKPALLSWGQGSVSFAENRRTVGGPVDHTMPVMRIGNLDGSLRGVLITYACHGITLGPDVNQIHGDWMGQAQDDIEANHPGAMAMVSVGCAGDLHPEKRDKLEYLKLYGKQISEEVDRVLSSRLTKLTTAPVGKMKWIKIPFEKVPSFSELIELTKDTTVKGYYARLALERVQRGEKLPSELEYPLQVWTFGDKLMMVNMGGEVVVDYALKLKKEYGADRLWINAYANDMSCYIPSRRILKEGGYEAEDAMYWYNLPSALSSVVEDQIMSTIMELTPLTFEKGSLKESGV